MTPIPWEGVGVLFATFVTVMAKSSYNGRLRESVIEPLTEKQRTEHDAHAAIPEVCDTLDRVESKVDTVDAKVDTLQNGQREVKETVAYLHREDVHDDPLARQRLGVESDDDILQGDD